jgi:hypothetical protein
MLHSMEGEAVEGEPGIVYKAPDWMHPFASAERGHADGAKNPLLRKHLSRIRFQSFTSDAAGIDAWLRTAEGVK